MKNTIWFKDLSIKDIDVAGGKGASLGEMYDLMPVPDGFVVSAQAYERFAEKIKDKIFPLLKIDVEDPEKLDEAAKKVQKIILDAEMPSDIVEDIKKGCGWTLKVAPRLEEVSPPSFDELMTLRLLDPNGLFIKA